MQFSLLALASFHLASAMIITSPKFGDVIHRDQLFDLKWTLSTKFKEPGEYLLGIQELENTWIVQNGAFKIHTAELSQQFWGAVFPKPGQYAIVVYEVGATSDDMPIYGSDFFTVV